MQFLSYFPEQHKHFSDKTLVSPAQCHGWLQLQAISRIPQLGIFSHDTRYHHPLLPFRPAVSCLSPQIISVIYLDFRKVQPISFLEWQIVYHEQIFWTKAYSQVGVLGMVLQGWLFCHYLDIASKLLTLKERFTGKVGNFLQICCERKRQSSNFIIFKSAKYHFSQIIKKKPVDRLCMLDSQPVCSQNIHPCTWYNSCIHPSLIPMAGLGEQKLVAEHLMQSDWHNCIVPPAPLWSPWYWIQSKLR